MVLIPNGRYLVMLHVTKDGIEAEGIDVVLLDNSEVEYSSKTVLETLNDMFASSFFLGALSNIVK